MKLPFSLPEGSVLSSLNAPSKKLALKEIAAALAEPSGVGEKEIFNALKEREQAGCTGMGSGVCIPHARIEGLQQPVGVFARLADPIEFGAADSQLVDLLFVLLTPANDDKAHIAAISAASRILRDKDLCNQLRSAAGTKELRALLLQAGELKEPA